MYGTLFLTNQDHFRAERKLAPSLRMPGVTELKVAQTPNEQFWGFGVAITPSSCYELSLMDAEERTKLLRHLYSEEGLGLSIGRICIGSSDYSPELYSYDDVKDDVALTHFSIQRDEEYVIPIIKEILTINPDLYLFASPWSPPYWMKTGGSMCGGYMREQYLECYADYIVKFIRAYAEHGVRISAVTPQNEPEALQKGRMPACVWHPEAEARFVNLLRQGCKQNGLDIEIWMHDHNFDGTERVLWSLENCVGLKESCDGVAFHYYGGTVEQTASIRRQYPNLNLHFTEGGPRLTDHYDSDWCKWGLMIAKAMKVGYRSFTGWNLMLDELGGPNIGPFIGICGGFVTRDSRTGDLRYSGMYKAYLHIAPYVTRLSKIYSVAVGEDFDIEMSKFPKGSKRPEGMLIENPDGERVLVLINPNEHGMQTQIEIDGTYRYIELQADSIVTAIFSEKA